MKILDRYIGWTIISTTLTVLVVLVGIFTFFAFIDQLEDVGHGVYTVWKAAGYVALNTPGLTYQLFPMAALIGALLVGLMANYTGFLAPKVALFSNIALMVGVLLWRPQGVYPVANR